MNLRSCWGVQPTESNFLCLSTCGKRGEKPGSCPLECQELGSAVGYLAVGVDPVLVSIPTWPWWEGCGQEQVPLHP